ncbi:hypothetical protein HWV62_15156 [Athelia sp. TMB]|nr:hypothetical protein HWV62_15156 [Athelia sp. TMB]
MPFEYTVYKGSKQGIVESTSRVESLGPYDVLIRITHSGVCGTDEHFKEKDMVLGHEGIGVVQEVGERVTFFKIGQRAGWGYQHDSCGRCKQCLTGSETFCPKRHFYGLTELDQGSFATHAVWKESFLFDIPDGLDSLDAAPLMCAGGTVFNALSHGVQSTHRVGIVGVGGLGHLCIMFAAKMGCEVVVFSQTDSKKEEALKLGATEFVATKGLTKLNIEKLDHLLVTTSVQPDWDMFARAMAPQGTIYPMTVSDDRLSFPYATLIAQGLRIQGVIIPARNVQNKMLLFAARHGIKPITQTFPLSVAGAEEALRLLDEGKIRYRAVLLPPKAVNGQSLL